MEQDAAAGTSRATGGARGVCPNCGTEDVPFPSGTCPRCYELVSAVAPWGGRACIECGYDLSGLPLTGACPECGVPVWRSLLGDGLGFSSARYLATVVRGLSLVMWGIIGMAALAPAGLLLGPLAMRLGMRPAGCMGAALVGLSALVLVGYWKLTAPDPRYAGSAPLTAAPAMIRATVVVQAVAMLALTLVVLGAVDLFGFPFAVLWLAAAAARFFAVMGYLAFLAQRMPDTGLVRRAEQNRWLLPLLSIFVVMCFGIPGIVAAVMYWSHLDAVRGRLRVFLARAEMNDAAGISGRGIESPGAGPVQ